jgi:hypothetical protein
VPALLVPDFVSLCRRVLEHHGYTVTPLAG